MPSKKYLWRVVFFALSLLAIDILTKYFTYRYFVLSSTSAEDILLWRNFFGIDLALTYTPNTGAAWGWFAEWQTALLIVRIGMVVSLAYYLCMGPIGALQRCSLAAITAGALGNILDTLFYGHVIDFILFTFWGMDFAVFNFADSAITLGAVAWIFSSFFDGKNESGTAIPQQSSMATKDK